MAAVAGTGRIGTSNLNSDLYSEKMREKETVMGHDGEHFGDIPTSPIRFGEKWR
jgi:hypothetical protein